MCSLPPTVTAPPNTPEPTRTARLLGLVRRLITYGKDLTATLQRRPSVETIIATGLHFGVVNVAIILARIARALQLAEALEARLALRADRPEPARREPTASAPRKPRNPRPKAPPNSSATLPTAEEIAEQLRRRPVYAVLADICRDLGLTQGNPLWQEVQDLILEFRGSGIGLLKDDLFVRIPKSGFFPWDTNPRMTPEQLLQIWQAPPVSSATAATGPP